MAIRREESVILNARIWLVVEFHCFQPRPSVLQRVLGKKDITFVSVWISGRPLSPDKELTADVAQKLVGPIPFAMAQDLIKLLREQLGLIGVEIIEDSTADD